MVFLYATDKILHKLHFDVKMQHLQISLEINLYWFWTSEHIKCLFVDAAQIKMKVVGLESDGGQLVGMLSRWGIIAALYSSSFRVNSYLICKIKQTH